MTLSSAQSSYGSGADIPMTYQYGSRFQPQPQDFIGIFPTNTDPTSHSPMVFLFLCQQQTPCGFTPSVQGQVVFSDTTVGSEGQRPPFTWPLDAGDYQAFLLRGTQAPFTQLAQSQVLTVQPDFHTGVVIPAVRAIEADVRALIANDPFIGPKFVRMGFHDCVTGCDGCIDLTNPENNGLESGMDALRPIVAAHENPALNISRADIWAIASHVGCDVAQERSPVKVDFSVQHIGRTNCEDKGTPCFDKNNQQRPCNETLGPFFEVPSPDTTTDGLFHYMFEVFGFDVQESVALMGAHTIGRLDPAASGFDGPNGWVRDNLLLNNDYYHELVGGNSPNASMAELVDNAPPWSSFRVNNCDLPGVPNRSAWHAFPPIDAEGDTVEILMLNADVSTSNGTRRDSLFPTLVSHEGRSLIHRWRGVAWRDRLHWFDS